MGNVFDDKQKELNTQQQLEVVKKGLAFQRQKFLDHEFGSPMDDAMYGRVFRVYQEFLAKERTLRNELFDMRKGIEQGMKKAAR